MAAEILAKRSKEKFFRGKNVEEIRTMDTREFAKLVKSSARRAILRNYDVIEAFVKRCETKEKRNKNIKTHNRSIIIVPALLDKTIGVYNGKEYIRVDITHEMLGHRLGEFSATRKVARHTSIGGKKKK